jgi:hypothetical protein
MLCAWYGMLIYLVSVVAAACLVRFHVVCDCLVDRIALAVVAIGPGMYLWVRSTRFLTQGVRNDRWTDAEQEWMRKQVERPAWWVLSIGLIAATGVCIILNLHHSGFGFLIYLFVFPIQAVTGLRGTLRKQVSGDGRLLDWSAAQPLHSDHWGRAENR